MTIVLNSILILTASVYCIVLLIIFTGLFRPNNRTQSKKLPISVIIAARNEEENIANVLSDLMTQTYPKDKYEIIVVDDHSHDRTTDIVKQFIKKGFNLKLIHTNSCEEGLTAKKNTLYQGIKKSCGEIIFILDADCRVLPTWIEVMVSYFTPEVGMLVGFSQLGTRTESRSLFQQLQAIDFLSLMAAAQGAINIGMPLASSGQNLAYRRDAFEDVGGFSKIGHRISGDDVLLLQLIHRNTSWKIRFAPSTSCFNSSLPETTMHDFLNQRIRWASNGSYQFKLNKGFFFYVTNVFLFNLALLISIPYALVSSYTCTVPFLSLTLKSFFEGVLIWKGSRVYMRPDLVKFFPLWFLLQIPYVVLMGFLGTMGSFTWKDRQRSSIKR